jgi:hypothetical protein
MNFRRHTLKRAISDAVARTEGLGEALQAVGEAENIAVNGTTVGVNDHPETVFPDICTVRATRDEPRFTCSGPLPASNVLVSPATSVPSKRGVAAPGMATFVQTGAVGEMTTLYSAAFTSNVPLWGEVDVSVTVGMVTGGDTTGVVVCDWAGGVDVGVWVDFTR